MVVATNRYYNDPQLGQAFSNLAEAFRPPSPSEILAGVSAQAKRAEMQRADEVYRRLTAAGVSREEADRYGIAGGLYNPNSSYYSVDQGNATTRRGQDVAAGTSRANNADNNRADLLKTALQPTREGEVSPGLPKSVADFYRVPTLPGGRGIVKLNEGQRAILPPAPGGGPPQALEGRDKPMSEGEWKAALGAKAVKDGLIDDAGIAAIVMSGVPVETVQGPGGVPTYARRNDAVGRPAAAVSTSRPQNGQAVLRDGTRVPAVQGPNGRWVHAQTGAPLPDDITITNLATPQGSNADIGLSPTTANTTSANNQAAEITRTLNMLDYYEGLVRGNPGVVGLPGLIRGTAQNAGQVIEDLTKAYGSEAPKLQGAANDIKTGLQRVAPGLFDPKIPEAQFYQGTLAYALARSENPTGEVSRQAYDRAFERIQGGMLANSASALAATGALRKTLQSQLDSVRVLRDPTSARVDTGFQAFPGAGAPAPGGAPAGGPQPGPAMQPSAPRRRRYNPETGLIE